jgi:hypothetical protein
LQPKYQKKNFPISQAGECIFSREGLTRLSFRFCFLIIVLFFVLFIIVFFIVFLILFLIPEGGLVSTTVFWQYCHD